MRWRGSRANNRVACEPGFSARAAPLMVPLVVRLAGGLKRQAPPFPDR